MTIVNMDHYMSNIWDWGFLNRCFGNTNIRVTDIDGMVERKGKFLVIETKSHDAPIPEGQKRMFEAMKNNSAFTVLIIWGDKNLPQKCKLILEGNEYEFSSVTAGTIQDIVSMWFHFANQEVLSE